MSRWEDRFENHPFKNAWTAVKSFAFDKSLEKENRSQVMVELARLRKVVSYIDSAVNSADPDFMPETTMNALNQHATNCQNELNAFSNNQNVNHLTNANNHLDQIIVALNQTPFSYFGENGASLSETFKGYSSVIDEYLEKLRKSVDDEISTVKSNVGEIQNTIPDIKKGISELRQELKSVRQTIEKQTAEFNTQFQSNEKSRQEEFDGTVKKLHEKVDTEFEKLSVKAGTLMEALSKFHDDAEKVFGVVINTLQAGAYSSYANREKRTANWLRGLAFVLMVTGVLILVIPELVHMYKDISTYVLDWKNVIGRSIFAAVLFIPGFYLAKESSRHRNNEIINRRRELILSTIDPYLALLDQEKAEEIKMEIAKGIFSEGSLPLEKSEGDTSSLVAQITNLVKQYQKSG